MSVSTQEKSHMSRQFSGNKVAQAQSAVDSPEDFSTMVSEVTEALTKYCAHRPRVVAGVIFGIGFVLGWKMRPW